MAKLVMMARDAQRYLAMYDIIPEVRFSEQEIADDVWETPPGCIAFEIDENEIEYTEVLDPQFQDWLEGHLKTAVELHNILVGFQDFLLTTMHPEPPSDAEKYVRDANTFFEQTATNIHPAALDSRQLGPDDHNGSLCNATMRHAHNGYCQTRKQKRSHHYANESNNHHQDNDLPPHQRKRTGCRKSAYEVSLEGTKVGCRFDYPKDLCEKTHMVVKQFRVKNKDGSHDVRHQLEIKSKRNDGWLNTHMDPLLTLWRANFDLQLTIDVGKITNYMTKYMTKSEAKQTKGAQAMIRCIMRQALDEGNSTEYVLQKMMAKLHGEPMISKQAVHHLIMSQPVVDCSHSFSKVNLENNSR
jgi:hypothetical protein